MHSDTLDNSNNPNILKGVVYLIPTSIGDHDLSNQIPTYNKSVVSQLDEFIVENERTARRFLIQSGLKGQIDKIAFHILDEECSVESAHLFLQSAEKGKSIGLLSEAGYPCIADPGQKVVLVAHQKGIRVVPLAGPSSILMALASSGLNGQSFAFHGYLPRDRNQLRRSIRNLEMESSRRRQTQIFMETPYRNTTLLNDILNVCAEDTLLCIATNIMCQDEFIKTMDIKSWRKKMPDVNKKPGIFLIYRNLRST